MSLPPLILDVTWARPGDRPRRVWLPVVLLWPLLALLWLLALALALLADVVLQASGRRGWRLAGLVTASLEAVAEARGLRIRVNGAHRNLNLVLK